MTTKQNTTLNGEVRSFARAYLKEGIAIFPLPAKRKKAALEDWPKIEVGLEDVEDAWDDGQNIAGIMGKRSGNLACVDLDCPEASALAGRFLEPTATSGHGENLEAHWWYCCDGGEAGYQAFKDLDGTTVLGELRGDGGHYTVLPPSTHPSGEEYRFKDTGLRRLRVDPEDLKHQVRILFTAVLIARHLPEHRKLGGGGRHDLALCLCGLLLRDDRVDFETVLAIMFAAWGCKGWPSEQDRREAHRDLEGAARDTYRKLAEGKKVKGGRELNKMVPGLASKIADYWKWSEQDGGSQDQEVGITKQLADAILEDDHFARDAGGKLYRFSEGAYRQYGERYIRRRVKELLEERGETKKWSSHRASEVCEYIRADAPELWERPPLDELNVLNGILNVHTKELRPHSPDFLSPVQLPVGFDPDATCSAWVEFISEVFPEDAQELAFEIVADLMTPERSHQDAILLLGEGSNGKGAYLAGATAFVGSTNVSGLSLQKLEGDRFATARLIGKLGNICPDLPSTHLTSTSTFKALTGNDRVPAEYKYRESFEFLPYARLIFSANQVPRSEDASYAFFRRWTVCPFNRTFEEGERTPRRELDARLAEPRELSGVLNKALEVLPRIREKGFTKSESMREAWEEFRAMTDPVSVWLGKATVESAEAVVPKSVLLKHYNAHCDERGQAGMSSKAFSQAIKRLRPNIAEGQRTFGDKVVWCWIGLGLASPEPDPSDSQRSRDSRDSTNCFSNEEAGGGGPEITNKEDRVNRVNHVKTDGGAAGTLTVGAVLAEFAREGSGPAMALAHYQEVPSDQRFEYLVKAVLDARGIKDLERWREAAPTVERAVAEWEAKDAGDNNEEDA